MKLTWTALALALVLAAPGFCAAGVITGTFQGRTLIVFNARPPAAGRPARRWW